MPRDAHAWEREHLGGVTFPVKQPGKKRTMETKNAQIGGLGSSCMRMSAIDALDDLIARYRREADRLQALRDEITGIEGEAEAALWQLVMDARR